MKKLIDDIQKDNKIPGSPGCDKLTKPEEIAALSRFLKKVREVQEEHVGLETDSLELTGSKDINGLGEVSKLSSFVDPILKSETKIPETLDRSLVLRNGDTISLSTVKIDLEDRGSGMNDLRAGLDKLVNDENRKNSTINKLNTDLEKIDGKTDLTDTLRQQVDKIVNNPDAEITLTNFRDDLDDKKGDPSLPLNYEGLDVRDKRTGLPTDLDYLNVEDNNLDLSKGYDKVEGIDPVKSLSSNLDRLNRDKKEDRTDLSSILDRLSNSPNTTTPLSSVTDRLNVGGGENRLGDLVDKLTDTEEGKTNLRTDKERLDAIPKAPILPTTRQNLKDIKNEGSLSGKIETLSANSEVPSLENQVEQLAVQEDLPNLRTTSEKLIDTSGVTKIEGKVETFEVIKDLKSKVDNLSINTESLKSLNQTSEKLSVKENKLKLGTEDNRERLITWDEAVKSLSSHKELRGGENSEPNLSTFKDPINIPETKTTLSDYRDEISGKERIIDHNLGDYRESRGGEDKDQKELSTFRDPIKNLPESQPGLSNHREEISSKDKIVDHNLSDYKEEISGKDKIVDHNLSDYKEEISGKDKIIDHNLSDYRENIEDSRSNSLYDDNIKRGGEDKNPGLEEKVHDDAKLHDSINKDAKLEVTESSHYSTKSPELKSSISEIPGVSVSPSTNQGAQISKGGDAVVTDSPDLRTSVVDEAKVIASQNSKAQLEIDKGAGKYDTKSEELRKDIPSSSGFVPGDLELDPESAKGPHNDPEKKKVDKLVGEDKRYKVQDHVALEGTTKPSLDDLLKSDKTYKDLETSEKDKFEKGRRSGVSWKFGSEDDKDFDLIQKSGGTLKDGLGLHEDNLDIPDREIHEDSKTRPLGPFGYDPLQAKTWDEHIESEGNKYRSGLRKGIHWTAGEVDGGNGLRKRIDLGRDTPHEDNNSAVKPGNYVQKDGGLDEVLSSLDERTRVSSDSAVKVSDKNESKEIQKLRDVGAVPNLSLDGTNKKLSEAETGEYYSQFQADQEKKYLTGSGKNGSGSVAWGGNYWGIEFNREKLGAKYLGVNFKKGMSEDELYRAVMDIYKMDNSPFSRKAQSLISTYLNKDYKGSEEHRQSVIKCLINDQIESLRKIEEKERIVEKHKIDNSENKALRPKYSMPRFGLRVAIDPLSSIRWIAENIISLGAGIIPGSIREELLKDLLELILIGREKLEWWSKAARHRLPGDGDDNLLAQYIGHKGDFAKIADAISAGDLGRITRSAMGVVAKYMKPGKHDKPTNRPKKVDADSEKEYIEVITDEDYLYAKSNGTRYLTYNNSRDVDKIPSSKEGGSFLKKIGNSIVERTKNVINTYAGAYNKPSTQDSFDFLQKYLGGNGMLMTIGELMSKDAQISSIEELQKELIDSPWISTANNYISARGKWKAQSLDYTANWELRLSPYVCTPELVKGHKYKLRNYTFHNNGFSYLPSISEINVRNWYEFNVTTSYTDFIPASNFELQHSKVSSKEIPIYEGTINIPTNIEFLNEFRITIVDDAYKSWRWYFERCSKAAVYNSEYHDGKYYQSPSPKITAIDQSTICIAPYKNVTFQAVLYIMTPQYENIKKYNMLLTVKEFTEEMQGDTEGSGSQDLSVTFSIVGEGPREIENEAWRN